MSGLNMKGLPFESQDPLIGSELTIFVPVELIFQLKGNNVEFDIKGGGFGFLDSIIRSTMEILIARSANTKVGK